MHVRISSVTVFETVGRTRLKRERKKRVPPSTHQKISRACVRCPLCRPYMPEYATKHGYDSSRYTKGFGYIRVLLATRNTVTPQVLKNGLVSRRRRLEQPRRTLPCSLHQCGGAPLCASRALIRVTTAQPPLHMLDALDHGCTIARYTHTLCEPRRRARHTPTRPTRQPALYMLPTHALLSPNRPWLHASLHLSRVVRLAACTRARACSSGSSC